MESDSQLVEICTLGETVGDVETARTVSGAPTVESVAERRAMLKALGSRPGLEEVDQARRAIEKIDAQLADQLESTYYATAPVGVNVAEWREAQEVELKEAAEKEKSPYRAVIKLDELHQLYEDKLEQEELALDGRVKYEPAVTPQDADDGSDTYASGLIQDAFENKREGLDLSRRSMVHVPEFFGRIVSLVRLNLSSNQLQALPDSVAGLVNLEELNLHSNNLKALPDSIGLLAKLKYLTVSNNVIKRLPDSLGRCSSLVEFDANFNQLDFISTDFGLHLVNLEKLDLHLNKLSAVPSSFCQLWSLKYLDLRMNKLRGLPSAIGNLSRLEYLNVSSNFNDLVDLPESIGDLVSLEHFDLSFNQIRELPDSMGRLERLKKLNLDGNPMVVPPMEVAEKSLEAVMEYMKERWRRSIEVEEQLSEGGNAVPQAGAYDYSAWIPTWAAASVNSWVNAWWGNTGAASDGGPGNRMETRPVRRNDFLEQQL
ncbi:unnamed protein product [Calypogeia fissa]